MYHLVPSFETTAEFLSILYLFAILDPPTNETMPVTKLTSISKENT